MLIKKWKKTLVLLLMDFDFNLHITIASTANPINNLFKNLKTEDIWKEYIIKSVGDIPYSDGINKICLYIAKDGMYDIYEDMFFGNTFIDYYWNNLLDADGVRIKITNINGDQLTRIIVR